MLKDGTLVGSSEKLSDELLLQEPPQVVAGVTECDTSATADSSEKLVSRALSKI